MRITTPIIAATLLAAAHCHYPKNEPASASATDMNAASTVAATDANAAAANAGRALPMDNTVTFAGAGRKSTASRGACSAWSACETFREPASAARHVMIRFVFGDAAAISGADRPRSKRMSERKTRPIHEARQRPGAAARMARTAGQPASRAGVDDSLRQCRRNERRRNQTRHLSWRCGAGAANSVGRSPRR